MMDPTQDPEYWKTKKRLEEKSDTEMKKDLNSTIKLVREFTEEGVSVFVPSYTEKKEVLSADASSLYFEFCPKDKTEILRSMVPVELNNIRVYANRRSCVIPQASISSFGTWGNGSDILSRIRFSQLMDLKWYKEREKEETQIGKNFEHKKKRRKRRKREKRERKKREQRKREKRWTKRPEEKKYYYRFLLPIQGDNWSRHIDNSFYHYGNTTNQCDPIRCGCRCGLIRIDFSERRQVHIFPVGIGLHRQSPTTKAQYLVIESQSLCTYREMHEYMYAISLSLGLVTSVAPFDYVFVIASEMPRFDGKIMGSIVQLRPTIRGQISFFTTSIEHLRKLLGDKAKYAFLPYYDEKGEIKKVPDLMTEQEFARLAFMLYRNEHLARAALMLIDSSMNLECMGATYAVALETICSVLIEANKELLPKHRNRKGKEIRRKNEEKLTEPFMLPQIGYELSEEKGKELVDIRNSFLHGGVLGFSHTEYHKLQYPCMKLRCFCGILLLRYSGYKGPILNNAVALGLEEALKNKEPLFITYKEKTEAPQPTDTSDTTA